MTSVKAGDKMARPEASIQAETAEQTLTDIARRLPPNRLVQLVDFAGFLEAQVLVEELAENGDEVDIEAENAKWDALLATEEAQDVLDKLADEALEEHRAGRTRPMRFTGEGHIVPG